MLTGIIFDAAHQFDLKVLLLLSFAATSGHIQLCAAFAAHVLHCAAPYVPLARTRAHSPFLRNEGRGYVHLVP